MSAWLQYRILLSCCCLLTIINRAQLQVVLVVGGLSQTACGLCLCACLCCTYVTYIIHCCSLLCASAFDNPFNSSLSLLATSLKNRWNILRCTLVNHFRSNFVKCSRQPYQTTRWVRSMNFYKSQKLDFRELAFVVPEHILTRLFISIGSSAQLILFPHM